ncbi:hypothetical protein [Limnohabitans sp.]|uniref:hypothetical protein n=1 Tax=Limnohabitans sp. TaxID=1907725 RepID=UPI00286F109C|nr:hypothetical protein [Limnohabitans sp.]
MQTQYFCDFTFLYFLRVTFSQCDGSTDALHEPCFTQYFEGVIHSERLPKHCCCDDEHGKKRVCRAFNQPNNAVKQPDIAKYVGHGDADTSEQ